MPFPDLAPTLPLLALAFLAAAAGLAYLALALRALSIGRDEPIRAIRPKGDAAGELEAELERFAGLESALASLIRVPTVSRFEETDIDPEPFAAFPEALALAFPVACARFARHEAGPRAILYEWAGSDGGAAILASHWDVVPPGDGWTVDPFGGELRDGFIYGRGAQDTKLTIAGTLAAAESLLAEGFVPRRSIYFAFGGDEEIGGRQGAASIAAKLASMGVHADLIVDEGGPVAIDAVPFARGPLALVGVAEKGYADVIVEAPGSGGHASMPPKRIATVDLAKAVVRLSRRPFPARSTRTLARMLAALSSLTPFPARAFLASPKACFPLLARILSSRSATDALVRTSTAVTMLSGSGKENVLPERASAVVNARILPGETVGSTLGRISRVVAPLVARVAPGGYACDPSEETEASGPDWDLISYAIGRAFPEATPIPYLFCAGTDTKHYRGLARSTFRFSPMAQDPAEIARIHAADERISVGNLRRCALFYRSLLERL
jgi:carboxypeptidase PM20D1